MAQLRFFSSGGGKQSIAALVLSAQGLIDYPVHIFCNVGDDSEHPDTLRYIHDVAMPYAQAHGIEFMEIFPTRFKQPMTLYQIAISDEVKSIPIPLRNASGLPGRRSCTQNFKIEPIAREIKRRGAKKDDPAILGLGISIDEYQRMRNENPEKYIRREYPLIDLRLTRDQCAAIIATAGLPIPPKSACWFCPFKRQAAWRMMKIEEPSIFMNAVVLEYELNAKRARNGQEPNYLSSANKPLDQAFDHDQTIMDFDDTCESGFCMT